MIEQLLSDHGVELLTTVGQTLIVTVGYALGSSRLLERTNTALPGELEQRFEAIRRKWAGKEIARNAQ